MTGPDARPVGETAEPIRPVAVMRSVVGDAFDRVVSTVMEEQHGERHEFDACDCILAFYDALEELEAAVRAEARAALLRDAPVVWVAHEEDGTPWICERKPEPEEDDTWTFDGEFDMAEQWLVELLGVTPGTVRRYALVPHPEGEETANG